MAPERELFVLSSEWTRVRRTGLSELSRLPQACLELEHAPWRPATLVVPWYVQSLPARPERNDPLAKVPFYCHCLPCDAVVKAERKGETYRINGSLPSDPELWYDFCRRSLSLIEAVRTAKVVDLLVIDWPMAPILGMVPNGFRTCFTIDLPPDDPDATSLWTQGLSDADVIHAPTRTWLETLSRDYPLLKRLRHKCNTAVFGTAIRPFALDETVDVKNNLTGAEQKEVRKTELQAELGLPVDKDTLLIVCRNRWTSDDQKNYRSIVSVLPEVLRHVADNGWKVQFVIGPFGDRKLGKSRKLSSRLRKLQARFPGCVRIEKRKDVEKRLWGNMLKAADAQLIPSRYEPCGINHCQGMNFGALPICSTAGCMGDPPMNAGNSFRFEWCDAEKKESRGNFRNAIMSACEVYFHDREGWRSMQVDAIAASHHYDWKRLVPQYAGLYR